MVYGPGQQDLSKLIPYSVLSGLKGENPKISSGVRMVDWIYVDDLVDGLMSMMRAPGIDGETIELGSGKAISVKDIVVMVTKMIDEEKAKEAEINEQIRLANEKLEQGTFKGRFKKTSGPGSGGRSSRWPSGRRRGPAPFGPRSGGRCPSGAPERWSAGAATWCLLVGVF